MHQPHPAAGLAPTTRVLFLDEAFIDVDGSIAGNQGECKGGVNAMRMPVDDLVSNWACMVMAAFAWNLKSWFPLLV
jgi:hypothetical protein